MDWKNQLTKTPYLVLFIVLISIGVGTAAALITITLAGDVVIEGDLDMTNGKISNLVTPSVSADAATKGYVDSAPGTDTLALLGCATDQIARFDGNIWVCGKQTAKNNPITTVDSTDDAGEWTSIAIGSDNNPVISYYDFTSGDLNLAHCGNTSCSAGNTITAVDSSGDVGLYTSIAIGTDGNPVISYWDGDNSALKVAHCGNTLCSAGNSITTVDSANVVGLYTSIAIGTDDNPVISYFEETNGNLKVAHCGNTLCSAGNTITFVDSANFVGLWTSIAIGTDNNPVISYRDNTNDDLKVAHCGNISCSAGNTITAVDSSGDVGEYTSIAIGTDSNPVISYHKFINGELKVVHCGNASCSAGNTITIVDTGFVGLYTSIAIGTDGNPVISYRGGPNDDLKVAVDGIVLNFE